MKFCPFIGVACKREECELFIEKDSACSFSLLLKEMREVKNLIPSLKTEEESTLFRGISATVENILRTSGGLKESIERTIQQVSDAVEKTKSDFLEGQDKMVEKHFSALLEVVDKMDESFKQIKKSYQQTNRLLSELKKKTEDESARKQLEEAQEHNDRGVTLFYTSSREAAQVEFEKAIELNPELAEAYNNLALVQSELGHNDEAVENFKKAYSLRSDLCEAYSNLAMLHFRRGDLDEAMRLFEKSIQTPASSSVAHLNLGNGLLQLGRYEEAIGAWERALLIDPSNEDAKEKITLYQEGKLRGHHREDQKKDEGDKEELSA